jgi:UDP-galactopyranose mutase
MRIIIVGAGLSGATIANHCTTYSDHKVIVIEKRNHIAGNCYDEVDEKTGIRISKYGAHLFHTNNEKVWDYVNQFGKWCRWDHEVLSEVLSEGSSVLVPVPVNITTVNKLCNENIQNEDEMKSWFDKNTKKNDTNKTVYKNSEEVALATIGEELYEKLFKPYTFKQWNKYPKDLDSSVLSRIPVRSNFDKRYFSDKYQALPRDGYTSIINNMLTHKNIDVILNCDWKEFKKDISDDDLIIFTGPIDVYFEDTKLDKLEYRSIKFEWFCEKNKGFYQQNSVINYANIENPYTRCVEYKHFLNQKSDYTIYSKEIPCDDGEPYYPVPTDKNKKLYQQYVDLSAQIKNVHFIGRLASYKYFNMDEAIQNAMNYFDEHIKHLL